MVWDVSPKFKPVRSNIPRRRQVVSDYPNERRAVADRRAFVQPPEWAHGWLCFESGRDRLRLTPVPEGWETLPEDDLDGFRSKATSTKQL